jgi:hypothetical protein
LNQLGRFGIDRGELHQSFVKWDQICIFDGGGCIGQIDALPAPAALVRSLGAGMIDENPSHCRRGGTHESTFRRKGLLAAELQVGFVHQSRGVERVPVGFVRELGRGEPAQLIVDQRQEPGGGVRLRLRS